MSHDRNEKTPGILKVDQEIAYKVEIELLKRQLVEKEKAVKEDSVKQVEGVCDFCLEDHPNGHCLPGGVKSKLSIWEMATTQVGASTQIYAGTRQGTKLKLHLNPGNHLCWKSYSLNLLT